MAEETLSPAALCWSNIVKQQPAPNQNQHDLTAAADRVFVDSCKSTKGIAVAVVDANAIIQGGEGLANSSDKFISVSEVIDEVRDPTSRHRLNFLPFTVETSDPSPEALKKVISFARATGDLQTLSDVDLKLIALTYTLEAQIHGTKHLRDSPPPIHTINVKRLPEKDLPGWGSNVPNLEEWEALEHEADDKSNPNSRILPLQDLNLNTIPTDHHHAAEDGSMENDGEPHGRRWWQMESMHLRDNLMMMLVIGWPAVSRSTHRRFLRRQARREMYEALSEKDGQQDAVENIESDNLENERFTDQLTVKSSDETPVVHPILEERKVSERKASDEDLSTILNQMRLEEDSLKALEEENGQSNSCGGPESRTSTAEEAMSNNNGSIGVEGDEIENIGEGLEHLEISSQTNESFNASYVDDNSSEQSWMLRSLSESSVACVTSDFAMQNVLLQMGLRLLAPGGMQIRQLHRWILKCHACFKVTTEIGRIFCPSCGNGGTLRKVAVTVGENGIVLTARRPRVSLRGTQFSLPLPKGGRDAITKNPILREDQLPQKFLYPKKKKKNKQGDDIFSSDDIFRHHTDKGAPLQPPIRQTLAVFGGKRNPNDNHYSRRKR
ncbi:RNA-binding NOB1-like protein [Actinidia rufa]|uniref:RNA-binding NOB1-like protein n=1 Tax=Actinidia rufa TaxID=165716 RepID=A0A7J0D889_9ERIC|nr:RNA-binding NOB1-like protein [Actinidia rufa]